MPYKDPEKARIRARERAAKSREKFFKATLPYAHSVVSDGGKKRRALAKSSERGAHKGGRAAAMQAYTPAPIVLAPVRAMTLAEQEAKYGPL
jgi:cation transport regulator ChaB